MELTDLTTLSGQLITISAIAKIFVDLIKLKINDTKHAAKLKVGLSYAFAIASTLALQVSLFETSNQTTLVVGSVLAGGLAGLGSTYIHEILKALQTLKGLKK